MNETIKILILCGGKFSFPSIQLLGYEKFVCAVGIGKGDSFIVNSMKEQMEINQIAFQSFPNKESVRALKVWIDEISPDYIFSISFPFLIPGEVLAYGENKFINFHPGPLPHFRGPNPIFEVLRHQEKQTAITVHYMSNKFDEGPIIFKDSVNLVEHETYGRLAVKLSKRTAQVALNMANMLQFGTIVPSQVQEESKSCYFSKPEIYDTLINWKKMSASEIIALINACNPWNIGADTQLHGEHLKIISAYKMAEEHQQKPGTIIDYTGTEIIKVACIDDEQISIELLSSDLGIMTAKQFLSLQNIKNDTFT